MTKIGIIRCEIRAQECAGYKCLPAVRNRTAAMAQYEDELELVGYDTCGGCVLKDPGKTVERAVRLKAMGAEVIHLGNCLDTFCPWRDLFQTSITEATGLPVRLRVHP